MTEAKTENTEPLTLNAKSVATPFTTTETPPGHWDNMKDSIKASHLVKIVFVSIFVGIILFVVFFAKAGVNYSEDVNINEKGKSENNQLEQQIKKLQGDINDKDDQIKRLESTIRDKESQISKLLDDIKKLQDEKANIQTQIDDAKKELSKQENDISRLHSTISQKDAQITDNKRKISDLQNEIKAKDAELTKLNQTLSIYEYVTYGSVAANALILGDSIWTHMAISNYKKNITALQAENDKLAKEVGQLVDIINSKNKEIKDLNGQATDLDKKISDLKSTISSLETEKIDLQKQIDDYKSKKTQLETQYKGLQTDYDYVKTKYNDLLPLYTQTKRDYDDAMTKYNDINKLYTGLKADFEKKTADLQKLTTDYNQLNNVHNELVKTYGELNTNYNDLNTKYTDLTTKYNQLKTDYDALLASHTELQQKYNKLSEDYRTLQTNYADLTGKFDTLTKQYNDLKVAHQKLLEDYAVAEEKFKAISIKLHYASLDVVRMFFLSNSKSIYIHTNQLYNSTDDGFTKTALDAKINGKGPLLFLMETDDKYTFGAFVNTIWSNTVGIHKDDKAFTFSLNLTEICSITDPDHAYVVSDTTLLGFGNGDIVINEQKNEPDVKKFTSGSTDAGKTYPLPAGYDAKKFYHDGTTFTINSLHIYELQVTKP